MRWWSLLLLALLAVRPARAEGPRREDALGYLIGPCAGTDSKPQSKLWHHDGSYWCVIDGPEGNRIHELDGRRWKPLATPDALLGGHAGRADVLWDGRRLAVLMYDEPAPSYDEFAYDAAQRVWQRQPGFPVPLAIAPGSETMVLDEDSTGRLWAAYVADRRVWVAHSETDDHRTWSLPGLVLRDSVGKDDICSVIAFGGDRIGVFWSDQKRDEFGFRVHRDADPPDVWADQEIADSGSGVADDHIHLVADAAGRVYAVTKNDDHRLSAHLRAPSGTWTTAHDLLAGGDGTRPILQLAESDGLLLLLYTRWHEGDEAIVLRTSPLGQLAFGKPVTFLHIPNRDLNDVTGCKRSLPRGSIVALADGDGMAWWNGWGALDARELHAVPWQLHAAVLRADPEAALALDFDAGGGSDVQSATLQDVRGHLGGPWADDACEPAWVPGVSGAGLRFDGRRDFVEFGPCPPLDVPGSVTIEAWLRRAAAKSNDAILCKGTPGARSYQLRISKDDVVEFLREVPGGKNHEIEGRRALADSAWHHVAAVFDAEARQTRLYIDGVLDVAAPDSECSVVNDAPLFLGVREGEKEFKDWFHGDLDLVRITPRARYAADFEPPSRFETGGAPRVFLAWTPRYTGDLACPHFELSRGLAGAPLAPLAAGPLEATTFLDTQVPAGHVVYRVHALGCTALATTEQTIDWPPVEAPRR